MPIETVKKENKQISTSMLVFIFILTLIEVALLGKAVNFIILGTGEREAITLIGVASLILALIIVVMIKVAIPEEIVRKVE